MSPDPPDAHTTIRIEGGFPSGDPSGVREAGLIVLRGPELGRRFPIVSATTVIGRLPEADICIPDLSLSRRHCEILREDGHGYTIRDLGSTNGTVLNNAVITTGRLSDGDRIQVGEVLLKFTMADSVDEQFHHEVTKRIRHDRMTGLLNIDAFYQELDQLWPTLRSRKKPLSLIMFDIDGLKRVNDSHGHILGSEVVRRVAVAIREVVEASGGVAGLYGGDEYIAYVHRDDTVATGIADDICARVRNETFTADSGATLSVSISIGIAQYPGGVLDRRTLVHRADLALYAAKQGGRDRAVVFSPELSDQGKGTAP